jgi:hypothetical protein
MTVVQKFTRDLIANYLRRRGLKFLVDSDGDFLVQFAYSETIGCELSMLLMAAGPRGDVYAIRLLSNKRIPKEERDRILRLCNTWNSARRWPKAYLHIPDSSPDAPGEIRLEADLCLEKGVHQELLDDFTDTILLAGHAFWEWAHKEHGV